MTIDIQRSSNEKVLRLFICAYFLLLALDQFIKLVLNEDGIAVLLLKLIMAVLLCGALIVFVYRKDIMLFIMELIFIVLYAFTVVLGGVHSYSSFFQVVIKSLGIYIPCAVCIMQIRDYRTLWVDLCRIAVPARLLLYSAALLNVVEDYCQSVGYGLLFFTLISLIEVFYFKKRFCLIFVLTDLMIIIMFCSRGPLVCIGVFLLLAFWDTPKISNLTKIKISLFVINLILSVVIIVYFYGIKIWQFLSEHGVNSRTIQLLLTNPMHDSGRTRLYLHYMELIKLRPFLGYGLAGGWDTGYPHNFFIEIVLSFGIFGGALMCVLIGWLIIVGNRYLVDEERALFFIFLSQGVSLLYSGSFVSELFVYLFLGVAIDGVRQKKARKDQFFRTWEIGSNDSFS